EAEQVEKRFELITRIDCRRATIDASEFSCGKNDEGRGRHVPLFLVGFSVVRSISRQRKSTEFGNLLELVAAVHAKRDFEFARARAQFIDHRGKIFVESSTGLGQQTCRKGKQGFE